MECHPYFQQPKLRRYCKQTGHHYLSIVSARLCDPINLVGIVFQAYAPLGSPGRWNQQSDDPVVMEDPIIKEIAEKHGATPGQVKLLIFTFLSL